VAQIHVEKTPILAHAVLRIYATEVISLSKVHNLHLRQGTYYLRREIPADLKANYAPAKEIWRSLRTKNKAEAIRRLHEEMARLNDEFTRRLTELRAQSVERDFVYSERFHKAVDEAGDKLNEFGLAAPQYRFETADPVGKAYQEFEGYVDRPRSRREALELVEEALAQLSSDAQYDLSQGRTPDGEPIFGFPYRYVDRVSAFIEELIEADRRSLLAIKAEIEGQTEDKSEPTAPRSLASLLEIWKRQRKPANSSQNDMQTAIRLFERINGPLAFSDITDEHVRKFKGALIDLDRKNATKSKLWSMLRALLNTAKEDGRLDVNPFANVSLRLDDDSSSREIFNATELSKLFDRLEEKEEWWLGRLALYTGARLGEICQLEHGDIRKEGDHWEIYIKDDPDADKRVKNRNSIRRVPIHKQLIADGFLDWIKPKKGPLFGMSSSVASKRLNRRIKSAGIEGKGKVVHSLRHTFKTAAREVMGQEFHDKLTGHASQSVGQRYGQYRNLKEQIDKVAFGIEG
jgi:integrase